MKNYGVVYKEFAYSNKEPVQAVCSIIYLCKTDGYLRLAIVGKITTFSILCSSRIFIFWWPILNIFIDLFIVM